MSNFVPTQAHAGAIRLGGNLSPEGGA